MSTKANSARANPLVMARNESSTLFSLGDLDASRAVKRPQSPRRSTPSTKAPASEGSGLIDIHAMRALMTDQARASAAGSEAGPAATVPSFTGVGMGGLVADRLVDVTPAPVPAKPARPRTPALLYAVVGLLSVGLLGLGAYVALDQPPEQVVQQEIVAAPAIDEEPGEDPGEPASEAEQPEDSASEPEADASVAPVDPSEDDVRPRVRRTNRPRKGDPAKDPKPAVSQPASSEVDVDCLINNKLPKCKTGKPAPKPGEVSKPKPEPSDDLAAKLDQSQILAGIRPVKTAAKTCGSGTAVTIKFSVEGSSGRVVSAKALDEHASTSVGKCVAAAAMKASFAKFTAGQQGFSFKFRL